MSGASGAGAPEVWPKCHAVVREATLRDAFLVRAVDAPYERRDKLKQRGYRWRPADLKNGRVWWTTTANAEAEIAWLCEEIYGQEISIPFHPITVRQKRFAR